MHSWLSHSRIQIRPTVGPRLMKRFCSCGHEGIAVEIAKEQTLTNSSLVFRWLQLASYCVKSYQLVDWVAWITQLTQLAQMPYCIVNTVTHTHKHARMRVHTHTHTWCGVKYGNWGSASDQHGFVVEAVGSSVPVTHPGLSTGGSFSLLIISVPSYRLMYLYPCLWNYPLFTTVCKPL